MNYQYIIVYDKVTVKTTDYQDHSYLVRKSEIIVTAVLLKHTTKRISLMVSVDVKHHVYLLTYCDTGVTWDHAVSGRKSVIN